MDPTRQAELYEAAARAGINARCAQAYLHEVRGSMQALFSAVELLWRSANKAADEPERIEKARALAKRAIGQHEKTTLELLRTLTLQPTEAEPVDLVALLTESVHFLRNEAAAKSVALQVVSSEEQVMVRAERARLQSLLLGLLMAAMDDAPPGSPLSVTAARTGRHAILTLPARMSPSEEILAFADRLLSPNRARLDVDLSPGREVLQLHYPSAD